MKDTSWDRALEVTADGNGLVGYVGAVLLRKLADPGTVEAGAAPGIPGSTAHHPPEVKRTED